MNYLTIFVLWLHILAGVIWIGGMVFALLALLPSWKVPLLVGQLRILQNAQDRFQFLAARAAEMIILTGIFNVIIVGYYSQYQYSAPYMRMLTIKVALVVAMIVIRVVNSRTVLSRITHFLSDLPPATDFTDPVPESVVQLQKKSQLFLVVNTALGLIVLFLGLMLRNL